MLRLNHLPFDDPEQRRLLVAQIFDGPAPTSRRSCRRSPATTSRSPRSVRASPSTRSTTSSTSLGSPSAGPSTCSSGPRVPLSTGGFIPSQFDERYDILTGGRVSDSHCFVPERPGLRRHRGHRGFRLTPGSASLSSVRGLCPTTCYNRLVMLAGVPTGLLRYWHTLALPWLPHRDRCLGPFAAGHGRAWFGPSADWASPHLHAGRAGRRLRGHLPRSGLAVDQPGRGSARSVPGVVPPRSSLT